MYHYKFQFPSRKTEIVKDGIVYLPYEDPSNPNSGDYGPSILAEAVYRLGVSPFYAWQIADRLFKIIKPSVEKIEDSIMHSPVDYAARNKGRVPPQSELPILIPPKRYIGLFNASNFSDVGIKDLLEKTLPFNGHTRTATLIAIELESLIKRQMIKTGYGEADIIDEIPKYVERVLNALIASNTWPQSQDIAFRIKSTTGKSSPYQNRVKVGLDKAARSAVISLETQRDRARDKKLALTLEYGERIAKAEEAGDFEKVERLEEELDQKIKKITIQVDRQVKDTSVSFKQLQKQVVSRQAMIDLSMEEQQILETREQLETRRRQSAINPFVHMREAIAKWSGGLIGSARFSDDIRSVRWRGLKQRLSPRSILSNIKLEFVDAMREKNDLVKATLRAAGSILTLRPFSETIRQMAGEQREAHDNVAMVASDSASKPLSLEDAESGTPTSRSLPPPRPIAPSAPEGTPGADLQEIMAAVREQLETVIDETSNVVGEFIDGAKQTLNKSLTAVNDQISNSLQLLRNMRVPKPEDDPTDIEEVEFNIPTEQVAELTEDQIESASRELDLSVSKYGGIKPGDWSKVISLLRALSRQSKNKNAKGSGGGGGGLLMGVLGSVGLIGGAVLGEVAFIQRNRARLSAETGRDMSGISADRVRDITRAQHIERERLGVRARIRRGEANLFDLARYSIDRRYYDSDNTRAARTLEENRIPRPAPGTAFQIIQPAPPPPVTSPTPTPPAPNRTKIFRRSSKFANLGLDLDDHVAVGG